MCSNPAAIIYFPCYVEIISRDDTKKVVRKAVYTIYLQRLCLLPYQNWDLRGLTNLLLTIKKTYSYIAIKYTWVIDKIKVKGLFSFSRYKMLSNMCGNIIKTLLKRHIHIFNDTLDSLISDYVLKEDVLKTKMMIGDVIPWLSSRFCIHYIKSYCRYDHLSDIVHQVIILWHYHIISKIFI